MTLDEAADISFGIVDDYLLDGPEFQAVVEEVWQYSADEEDSALVASQVRSILLGIRNKWVEEGKHG